MRGQRAVDVTLPEITQMGGNRHKINLIGTGTE